MSTRLPARGGRFGRILRRITVVEWSLSAWYLLQGPLWGALLIAYPPTATGAALGGLLIAVAWCTAGGGILGTVGTLLTRQRGRWATIGLLLEQVGLLLLQAANVSYVLTQIALIGGPHGTDRIAFAVYVLSTSAALAVRQLFLVPKYLRAGHPIAPESVVLQ